MPGGIVFPSILVGSESSANISRAQSPVWQSIIWLVDAIVASIVPQLQAGDVVAILSNGGFDGIYEKLPARLKTRFA